MQPPGFDARKNNERVAFALFANTTLSTISWAILGSNQ